MYGQPMKGPIRVRDHKLYRRWSFMRNVCYNTRHSDYDAYGGKGIKIDPAFNEFWDFVNVIERKLGYPADFDYKWKLSRKDQNGDYTIKNLKWDNASEVGRRCAKAHVVTYKGKTKPLRTWAEELNINFYTVLSRFNNGWTPAQILGYKPGPRELNAQRKK